MGNDRVIGASVLGRNHATNQDRYGWRKRPDGSLIFVVADGAGSAIHGGEAAEAVVESLLAWQDSRPTMTVAEDMLEEMRLTQDRLHTMADKSGELRNAYNCTALLVHVSPEGCCHALSVGDSWLTYVNQEETWALPLRPQKGQYVNQTRFLVSTGPAQWQSANWKLPAQSFMVLLTDGLDDVAICGGTPYAPFFRSLSEVLDDVLEKSLWLKLFLKSERVAARCPDDRTVLHLTWRG